VEALSALCRRTNDSLRSRVPKVLAERRLNASHLSQCNRVAKELSRAFCERIERECLGWAKKWNFCGANSEKSLLPSVQSRNWKIAEELPPRLGRGCGAQCHWSGGTRRDPAIELASLRPFEPPPLWPVATASPPCSRRGVFVPSFTTETDQHREQVRGGEA
jgi:hypothetical protein